MSGVLTAQDLYWGKTNNKGKTIPMYSRVWDKDRFLTERRKEGTKADDPDELFTVSVLTKTEYRELSRPVRR